MKIHDISIAIKNGMPVYSGNPEVKITKFNTIPENSSNISLIEIGSHTGTHLDAPKHVAEKGAGMDNFSLEQFIGNAKVFDFSYLQPGGSVKVSDFEKILTENSDIEIQAGDIVLLKTSNSKRGYAEFYADFVYLDGNAAKFLADKKVKLVGIDYLSIKQKGSKDNRPHTELLDKNIPILEGINLNKISQGQYILQCFPIKFEDIDGSPTRAILIEN